MENGVEGVNGDHHEKDVNLALKNETLKLESVDTGSEGLIKDSANELKGSVEDSEPEIFYTPAYRLRPSDSQDMAFDAVERSDGFGGEKFNLEGKEFNNNLNVIEGKVVASEKIDARISDLNAEEQETMFETELNGIEDDGVIEEGSFVTQDGGGKNAENGVEELTEEKSQNGEYNVTDFDQDHGVLHEEVDNGVSISAISDEMGFETLTESMEQINPANQGGEVFETKLNDIETGSMTEESAPVLQDDGEKIPENSIELSEEESQNGEYSDMGLEKGRCILQEEVENGASFMATSDEVCVDTVTESKEQHLTGQGVERMFNGSAEFDSPSNGQTTNNHSLSVQPLSAHSETDNGTMGRTNASVVKEGTLPKQAKAEGSSSGSTPEVNEDFDGNSVLVEDMSDSSSNDDDGSIPSSQPAPPVPATVHHGSSGGPTLPSRPAGLGSSAPLLEPATRSLQQPRPNGVTHQRQSQLAEEPANDDSEENDETREKLQMIRVKFLRLAHRLGQTPHNVVVAQVLYRLGLAEQLRRNTNRPGVFSFDRANVMAEQLEATGREPIDFSCTVMVIGKTGVGKSATINSIFDEVNLRTNAFQVATKKVQDVVGTVQGIKVRIIDTPGLYPSSSDQWRNDKILRSVKKFISQTPPDIVLYFDRLDMQSRDYGDVPLLRSITDVFGSSIWFNAIIVLTHAASAPPDGPNGTPLSYEMFVSQRSHVVQQSIRQAAHDLRLMNPVCLVENHSACRMNRAGQRVLPNGQVWKPHLLLLSFASKILAEANMLLQLQDTPGRPFGARARVPPLPFFLSHLLQSRPPLKLPEEQFGDDFTGEEDLDDASDSDNGSDYDDLPPFKSLNKSQLAKLSKLQKKAYFEELDYREKLFFRKQLKEEKRRRKFTKKIADEAKDIRNDQNENVEDENSGPASLPVPMPDLALPTSFDSDNPTHRYRFLDTSNQWIVRPVLENHVWDHDIGYDGLNVERLFAINDKIPVSVSGQLTKDKKECTFQLELASSIKHSDAVATSLGVDLQTVGKDMAYTLRGETGIKNFRRNSTAAGVSFTQLGDAMSAGVKMEDNLVVNKRFKLLLSGGAMTGRGDLAYGGRLEATLRDQDFPIGRNLSTLALNVVDWHGDLALNCNIQSQIPLGRGTNVIGHANLNNKGTGQVGIRLNSSEQLQIALLALVPIFRHVKRMIFGSSQTID